MFPGIGTVANVLAILLGGSVGLLVRDGLNERYQQAVIQMLGICSMFIGLSGALTGMLHVEHDALIGLSSKETLGMILSLALGTLLGELADFDGKIEQLGGWLKQRAAQRDDGQFIQGFVSASLVVSIGAMAVVGSIQDGMGGDPSTLFTKATLDFIVVMIFASAYGKGALFSALPVGVFQGTVTLFSTLLAPMFSSAVVANLSFLGAIMIFCVGINLTFGNRIRVANMLPALLLGGLYTVLI